jgi:hypothetical protein
MTYVAYGLYVIGRQWFFVVLDGSEYAVSRAYDVTEEDVLLIGRILKAQKMTIEQQISAL